MNSKAAFYIDKLDLIAHPEGGYFKEIYRAEETISVEQLPHRYKSARNFSTSIYFLLTGEQVSHFHSLQSDELWHFYDGNALKVYIINEHGELQIKFLGRNIDNEEKLQLIIPRLTWFAAEVIDKSSYTLIGCTVAPGFDFNDFELGKKKYLLEKFPQHSDLIIRLSH